MKTFIICLCLFTANAAFADKPVEGADDSEQKACVDELDSQFQMSEFVIDFLKQQSRQFGFSIATTPYGIREYFTRVFRRLGESESKAAEAAISKMKWRRYDYSNRKISPQARLRIINSWQILRDALRPDLKGSPVSVFEARDIVSRYQNLPLVSNLAPPPSAVIISQPTRAISDQDQTAILKFDRVNGQVWEGTVIIPADVGAKAKSRDGIDVSSIEDWIDQYQLMSIDANAEDIEYELLPKSPGRRPLIMHAVLNRGVLYMTNLYFDGSKNKVRN